MIEYNLHRYQSIGFTTSLLFHILIFLLVAFLFKQQLAEFGMQMPTASSTSTDVELVAVAPTPNVPVVQPKPDEMVKPSSKKVFPKKTIAPTPPVSSTEGKIGNPSASGTSTGLVAARPDYLRNPPPPYPEFARQAHQEGTVRLSVEVSESGTASHVSISQSSGFSLLDTAALNAVKNWKFKPSMLGGIPQSSRVVVPVRFELHKH